MKKPFTASKFLGELGKTISPLKREPVLEKIFFFDNKDRRENPILEYSLAEIAGKTWMANNKLFERELDLIFEYLKRKCDQIGIIAEISNKYQNHLNELFDMEALRYNKFIVLRKIGRLELEKVPDEFRLRLQIEDLNAYILSRNLVYLTFMTLIQYTDSITEEYLYLLIILTFLMLYVLERELVYIDGYTDTIDYTIYEIAKLLSPNRRRKFDSLVSNSVTLIDNETADIIITELLHLLLGHGQTLSDIEERVDQIIITRVEKPQTGEHETAQGKRQRIQVWMHTIDSEKIALQSVIEKKTSIGLIENIISVLSVSDRFKSEYKLSNISAQRMDVLVTGNPCILSLVEEDFLDLEVEYHLHTIEAKEEKNDVKELKGCMISINVALTSYYAKIPTLADKSINIALRLSKFNNSNSNLIISSGTNTKATHFSPKFGILRPRSRPRIVKDSDKYIFEKSSSLITDQVNRIGPIINISLSSHQISQITISKVEMLLLMEKLLDAKLIESYEFDIFEEVYVLFILLDQEQCDSWISGDYDEDKAILIRKLSHISSMCLIFLFE